jgi:hypothetical protein
MHNICKELESILPLHPALPEYELIRSKRHRAKDGNKTHELDKRVGTKSKRWTHKGLQRLANGLIRTHHRLPWKNAMEVEI